MKYSIKYLIEKLEDKLKIYDFKAIVIGDEAQQVLHNNYFFSEQIENVHLMNKVQVQKSELLLIIGSPNLNLVHRIKEIYALMKSDQKKIIHITGGLSEKLQEKSYFVCDDLSEHLPVDFKITKYPMNVTELIEQVKEIVRTKEVAD